MICKHSSENVIQLFGRGEGLHIIGLAKKVDQLELYWNHRLDSYFEKINDLVLWSLIQSGRVPAKILNFDDFFCEQAEAVQRRAIDSVNRDGNVRLTYAKGKTPTSLRDLMIQWDAWRKKGKVPPRQRDLGDKIKKKYIKKVQSMWERNSEAFREGETYDQEKARRAIARWSRGSYSRAKMMVETETTYHYNSVRREMYDQADDVVGYLFMSIRDHRTTRWCRTRHGLVYLKGSVYLRDETPPIHWNCRSEILPLLRTNPRHVAILRDVSRLRSNHTCFPLPVEWGRRTA